MPVVPVIHSENSARTEFTTMIMIPLILNSVHLLLYGLYIFLFRLALLVLRKRPRTRDRLFHQISLYVLFIFASISIPIILADDIFSLAIRFQAYSGLNIPPSWTRAVQSFEISRKVILFIMGGTIDAILIFRCFVIWDYRRRYILLPALLCVLIDVGGVINAIASYTVTTPSLINITKQLTIVTLACVAALNIGLTAMISLKIYLTMRVMRNFPLIPQSPNSKRFSTIIAILLESGIIYVFGLLAYTVVIAVQNGQRWDAGAIAIQAGGIAPTLVIVRANTSRRGEDQSQVFHRAHSRDRLPDEEDMVFDVVGRKRPECN
ncbi:hypothetical protein L218DRAFT_964523 [Marasmius fiardii PR-910]|nr:hypothetical protein L218DRAFT_964523 [Marasmius fiardii PR-910]